jgi:hypothetical protein
VYARTLLWNIHKRASRAKINKAAAVAVRESL